MGGDLSGHSQRLAGSGCTRTHDANPSTSLSQKTGDLGDCAGAGGVLVGEAFDELAAVAVASRLGEWEITWDVAGLAG